MSICIQKPAIYCNARSFTLWLLHTPYAHTRDQASGKMKTSEELPTIFAQKLGERCGLLKKIESGVNHQEAAELRDRMKYFQQMAVTSKFEDCVAVYFGAELSGEKEKDLNDEQLSILKLIHRTTKPWITGHIVGVLMARIENAGSANKDIADAVRVLIEQAGEQPGELTKKVQGIMVKSTRRDSAEAQSK